MKEDTPSPSPKQDSQDLSPHEPSSIDLKRITFPQLFRFLRHLSLGSYAVLAGLIVGAFYIGVFVNELRKGSDGNQRQELETRVLHLAEEVNRSKLDLQMQSMEIASLKKEKLDLLQKVEAEHSRQQLLLDGAESEMAEALTAKGQMEDKIRALESSLSLKQRNEKELQGELLLARKTNAELSKTLESQKERKVALLTEIGDLEAKLDNRHLQQLHGPRIENRAYIIWAPESSSLPPIYIDNMHYALFKCLRKILPSDLLERAGAQASSFSVRSEKAVLSNVPHLYITSIQQGEHRFIRQDASARPPMYDSTAKVEAKTVHFIDIEQVDVYRDDQEGRTKLRTLDQNQFARAISIKIFDSMREDNQCLIESFLGR
jgi:hypothetical protein